MFLDFLGKFATWMNLNDVLWCSQGQESLQIVARGFVCRRVFDIDWRKTLTCFPTGYNLTFPKNRFNIVQFTAILPGIHLSIFCGGCYTTNPLCFFFILATLASPEETWMGRKRYGKTAGYLVQAPGCENLMARARGWEWSSMTWIGCPHGLETSTWPGEKSQDAVIDELGGAGETDPPNPELYRYLFETVWGAQVLIYYGKFININ